MNAEKIKKQRWVSEISLVFVVCLFFVGSSTNHIHMLTVGSDTVVSRQANVIFPDGDSDNKILGFATMENGFCLEDCSTTCTYDAFSFVRGKINLSGGTLFLNQDLVFQNEFSIVGGSIWGGGKYSVTFPSDSSALTISSAYSSFVPIDSETVATTINSVDWSYDGNYVALARASGTNEVEVYSFDGSSFTYENSIDTTEGANAVRWHPSAHFFLVGESGGDEVELYEFDTSTKALTRTDKEGRDDITAIAWHPSGLKVVTGEGSGTPSVELFDFDEALKTITSSQKFDLHADSYIKKDAISWAPGGNFVAIGCCVVGGQTDLKIYSFDGSDLTYDSDASLELGVDVTAVDWSPTGTYIAVGLGSGTERLRIYNHNVGAGTLTEEAVARTGFASTVNNIHWQSTGAQLLIATGSLYGLYDFDKATKKLDRSAGVGSAANAIRWLDDGCFVAGVGTTLEVCDIISGQYKPLIFKDANLVFNSDIDLTGTLIFQGDCYFQGNGNILDLLYSGTILVDKNSRVTFKNIDFSGLYNTNICCFDDSSRIIFDDVAMHFDHDYSFTVGSFIVKNNFDVVGTATFFYQSGLTSTIDSASHFHVSNGAHLMLGRKNSFYDRDPLYFASTIDSELVLDNATLTITSSGTQLARGKFVADHDVTIDMQTTCTTGGLVLGDGTVANDMICEWNAGAVVHVPRGHLVYNNTVPTNLQAKTKNTRFDLGNDFNLYLNQNLTLENLNVETCLTWGYGADDGKTLSYDSYTVFYEGSEYEIIGQRYDDVTNLLAGDHSIIVKSGALPLATVVMGTNNRIYGIGGIAQPIVLADSNAELTLDSLGKVLTDISMGGGTLVLTKPLRMGENNILSGQGTVAAGTSSVSIGGSDYLWTGTTRFECDSSIFNLKSDVSLASEITFNGDWVINGHGNVLDLRYSGSILVDKDSSVTFKNVWINGLSENSIRCFDSTGQIIFNEASICLNSNYSFTVGAIQMVNDVHLCGGHTFAYQSNMTSTVARYSSLYLDRNMTFSYDPPVARNNLVEFEDSTSFLHIDGATVHATHTGLQLTKGTMLINRKTTFSVESQFFVADGVVRRGVIELGDGNVGNDMTCQILQGTVFNVTTGELVYNNVGSASWDMIFNSSILKMSAGTRLLLNESLDLCSGRLLIHRGSTIEKTEGTTLDGAVEVYS